LKIYYAHSKRIYWSKREEKEIAVIQDKYPKAEIVNPSGIFRREMDWQLFMANEFPRMDLVVFSDFKGYIGKGVFEEINTAIGLEIPVLYLNENGELVDVFRFGEPNPEDWVFHCRMMAVIS